ncbi:hypothetical protein H5410_003778 [Solanum commersonii]|uniref:Uncharacterized protein n=1 Tax=Solanum commersonii TaxID=4109 RepID=A0A9J6B5K7_SOLCO|nr:hypothetical protein H5410_003778 [Solanum commersonii]
MVNDTLLFHSRLVMDCNKEEAIIVEEMMGNRKKTSIKSTKNCVYRHHVNYLSNEEEDASKRFKGVGYPSPTKESSEVKYLSFEESLQNTKIELIMQKEV